jgi:hypothetical protein
MDFVHLKCKVENIQLHVSVFWQLATFETSIILKCYSRLQEENGQSYKKYDSNNQCDVYSL